MNTVFVDVDTQLDFLCPAGALYSPGAEKIVSNLARLTRHAVSTGIKILSTTDAHSEDDVEFRVWKPHCVSGTAGQQKLRATLGECFAESHRYVLSTAEGAFNRQAALSAQQVIVKKQHVDCFTNPNLVPLLDSLGSARFVIYGVFTEVCVLNAARGLLRLDHPVEIVTDAVWPISEELGVKALDELVASGAKLTTVAAV
ncbi:MAG: isochorismatase family cysteine hydrolase [Bryobacteraceae bacterium]